MKKSTHMIMKLEEYPLYGLNTVFLHSTNLLPRDLLGFWLFFFRVLLTLLSEWYSSGCYLFDTLLCEKFYQVSSILPQLPLMRSGSYEVFSGLVPFFTRHVM